MCLHEVTPDSGDAFDSRFTMRDRSHAAPLDVTKQDQAFFRLGDMVSLCDAYLIDDAAPF